MDPNYILLLEDDPDRVAGFRSAAEKIDGSPRIIVWRDAYRMMAECHEFLPGAALISLDHDLNKERVDSPDPGDGVMVASFLARLPKICPVILHTSNTERVWSMHNELRFGGWPVEQVMPYGFDWIEKSWLPKCREFLRRGAAEGNGFFNPERTKDAGERLKRAIQSLHGLALGDCIGEMMVGRANRAQDLIMADQLPAGPWWHTDDTEMAISVVEVLRLLGAINQEALARHFAWRYDREPDRGYGSGARRQLRALVEGARWQQTAGDAFGGLGSLGNGSAMRVAPVGAWFADDLDRVVAEARASAVVTHTHPEGVAGAIAIAVAAAMAWRLRDSSLPDAAAKFLNEVLERTPEGETRRGIAHASQILQFESPQSAARTLGNGSNVTCPDTVPFTLWSAAKFLGKYRDAIAATASVDGDIDTNCAIVGGIVSMSAGRAGLPNYWLSHMEKLPYALQE